MADVKIGDVVKLKSGGPSMTVTGIYHHGSGVVMNCEWFVNDEDHSAYFPPDALDEAESGEPGGSVA